MFMRFILLNVMLLLISGCASKQDSLNGIDKHIIKSSELRIMMRDLNMVVNDEYKSELERDETRRRYAFGLADNVKEFSSIIKSMQLKDLDQNIDDADIQIFSKYTNNLQKNGEVIGRIAQNYELERLDNAINNLKRTCNSCHSTFRGY